MTKHNLSRLMKFDSQIFEVDGIPESEMDAIRNGKYVPEHTGRKMGAAELAFFKSAGMPKYVYHATRSGVLKGDLKHILAPVWTQAGTPGARLSNEEWTWLFRKAGFISYGNSAVEPPENLRLYRGCLPPYKRNMSWSTSRYYAELFAHAAGKSAAVYEMTAPRSALLAHYSVSKYGDEWVVDTTGLDIRLAKGPMKTSAKFVGEVRHKS